MISYELPGPLGPQFPCIFFVKIIVQIKKQIRNRKKSREFQDLNSGYFQGPQPRGRRRREALRRWHWGIAAATATES